MTNDKRTRDRVRFLTIHDGTPLTPGVLAVLQAVADTAKEEQEQVAKRGSLTEQYADQAVVRSHLGAHTLQSLDPILVSRSDGLAVYVHRHRRGL